MDSNFGKVRDQNTCSSQLLSPVKQNINTASQKKNVLPNVRIAVLLCMPKNSTYFWYGYCKVDY